MKLSTDGHRIYAIGDVHGRVDLLVDTLRRVWIDAARRPHPNPHVVMLGDYVDRGPDACGVIEVLIGLKESQMPSTCLLGNHDTYIEAYLEEPEWFDRSIHWLNPRMGGDITLASYGVADASEFDPAATRDAFASVFPASHRAFLQSCALYHRIGSYVFAHAGIRPGVPLERQSRDDLIWIREPFLSCRRPFGFKVVHGHTIVKAPEHHANRIAIDTGAYHTGTLTCLVLEDEASALLTEEGFKPFPPGSGLGAMGLVSGFTKFFKTT
jgi:serine/threonine protein phosphatase 1